jgi:RNA polymerase sigma-70 factor (ECF subfamily)
MRQNREQDREPGSTFKLDSAVLQAVQKLRAGIDVEESFARIEGWFSPRLKAYFRAHLSPEEAEDLVQKTFARVYLGVGQLEQEEEFLAWIFVIARNLRFTAVGEQQRDRQMEAGGIELAEEVADPSQANWSSDQQLDHQVRLDAVRAAIDTLPAQQRQCLLLRVRDELPDTEIASVLRLSVNTVRNHLAEAKKNLRRELKSELEEVADL